MVNLLSTVFLLIVGLVYCIDYRTLTIDGLIPYLKTVNPFLSHDVKSMSV